MKMLKYILAFAMLTAVLAGCGKKSQDPIPSKSTTQATLALTETTDAPTRETTDPTNVTEETATPTDNTEPATRITAVPTESSAVATQTTTAATKPTAKPTQATTAATKPAVIPTQTTAAATKPVTVATKPVAATTQATAAATKPAATTQATAAATKPAPTATQSTKPAATAHQYTLTSDTATCTASGTKTETCSLCGDKKTSSSPAKGHGTTRTETKEATATAAGYTRVICEDCNGVISETVIPKKESTHTCSYQRINCADLKDNAIPFYTAMYRTYTEFTILACSECGKADTNSLMYIYSTKEITAKIIELINQERYAVYGTHDYDVVASSTFDYAEGRAEFAADAYIRNGYLSHEGADYSENLIANTLSGNMVQQMFNRWKESSGHYSLIIDKDAKCVALSTAYRSEIGLIGCLVMTDTDCQHLGIPGNNNT